jgi:hypothetical protein
LRVEQAHQGRHKSQAVQTVLLASHLPGEQGDPAHQGGAHDGGAGADEECIDGNLDGGYQGAPPAPQQAPEDFRVEGSQDGNIESVD